MFRTVKRILDWCGEYRKDVYIGFALSFFSTWFAAMPVMLAACTLGSFIDSRRGIGTFDSRWIGWSFVLIVLFIGLRFLFDYFRSRFQEPVSYELVARDRLAIGEALKRVSLGYFQKMDTGSILSSITTGLQTLEKMGIRMLDTFIAGYLNYLCIFLFMAVLDWRIALMTFAGVLLSFFFLTLVSRHSEQNAPVAAQSERDLTNATIEYARGLSVVKSFGQEGASIAAMKKACRDSRSIRLKIEVGFIPPNCLHLFSLKITSVALAALASGLYLSGNLSFTYLLLFAFFSFSIFQGIEPISDSAHILGIIKDAFDQLDALKSENYMDEDGKEIVLDHYDIVFDRVGFGYDSRKILENVSFTIPQNTSAAIVGPSGSGKTTLCNLIARFYDVQEGSISIGGHDVREFTCDSLLKNISMVFQKVYLFHDTIRQNICFGRPDATQEEMIRAARKACCHDFIMQLPDGYDTMIGEGGDTLSGGEKQRISIARAMLKDAPIIILDEATASVDPENEHLIQAAITELTQGKTIITIAHRLATIQNADQILVVDRKTIAQRGTHEELLSQEGIYRQFIEIREKAEGWSLGGAQDDNQV